MIVGSQVPQTARQIEAIAEVVHAAALYVRKAASTGGTDLTAEWNRLADAVSDWEQFSPHSAMNLYAEEGD